MIDFATLPIEVLEYITKLRKESAKYRRELRDAQAELAKLRTRTDGRV